MRHRPAGTLGGSAPSTSANRRCHGAIPNVSHDPTSPNRSTGVSRRSFLKGTAAASVAGAGLAAAETTRQSGPTTLGPGEHQLVLAVNGSDRQVTVETRTTLLDALRNGLDLTGSKQVCDRGACGACTVLVDGLPVHACMMLAVDAPGRQIRTVESLDGPTPHPLVQSFVQCDALQCGFCTPGMVMASLACLERRRQPSREQMAEDLAGNLCRCGTYGRVMDAIERTAAAPQGGGR